MLIHLVKYYKYCEDMKTKQFAKLKYKMYLWKQRSSPPLCKCTVASSCSSPVDCNCLAHTQLELQKGIL